jgi:hypothetical protein
MGNALQRVTMSVAQSHGSVTSPTSALNSSSRHFAAKLKQCPAARLRVRLLQTRNDVSNLTHIATTDRDLPRQRGTLVRVGEMTDGTLGTIATTTATVGATLIAIATGM